jgi:hypothetical protein
VAGQLKATEKQKGKRKEAQTPSLVHCGRHKHNAKNKVNQMSLVEDWQF